MAKKWKDLTEKQKKQFGGNKKAFKEAKKQVKKSGGNAGSVLQIKNAYKAAQTPSPPPAAAPAPPPPAAAPSPPPAPAPSFKQAVKDLGDDGKINNKDFKELVENYGEKKVTNNLVKVADKNDIKIGNRPSEALGIKDQPAKTEPAKAEPTFKEAVKELAKDGKISNADYNDLKEQFGDKKVGNKLVKVADKNDIKIGKKPSKALGIDKQPDKTEAVETEAVETDDKPSFKEAVKELGSDGKINNKDYKELVDTYGEKKVGNKLEKVTDKNDIKIGNKPSQALGIKDQPAKTEPAKPEDTDDKPSFKEAVKELGSDGKINNKDYKELVDAYGDKKVDNKLVKVADKNDIKIGNKPSQALGIDKPEDTDDRPSFKEAVKDLGSDGKINNKDYQELVDTYGEKKVGNKLEKVTDKNDIKIGNRPSEALGINKPEDTDDKRSLEDAIIALGSDRKINNEDYKTLVAEFGSESVNNKLGNIAGENDIKIGKKPSKELEDDKAVRQELGLEKPEQSPPPPDVKKTGEGAFRKQIDKYYEDAEKKYTNRMGKFAADYRDGLTRYKGKKDESGRNKIQREYKDKRSEDAKAYDRDKSQFQKDKLNSLYAQRRDLLDDKGMVKRPSLDASTTPNPYEGAISEIKQALGIQKPNANYLKDQVKNSLTMKIKKPSLDLNIKGAESNAPKFKTKQFTRLDRNYKPRT
jgi:type III secretion system FlhB-like substrate exporter